MSYSTIASINQVYECSKKPSLVWHRIYHPEFYSFCKQVQALSVDIRGEGSDELLNELIRILRFSRYKMASTPLAFNSVMADLKVTNRLSVVTEMCLDMYPQYRNRIRDIQQAMNLMMQLNHNPLFDYVAEQFFYRDRVIGLLIRDSSDIDDVHDLIGLRSLSTIEVLTSSDLRRDITFDLLLVIGPSLWYPESILTAPRSRSVHIVHFGWISDRASVGSSFVRSQGGTRYSVTVVNPDEACTSESVESTGAEDLLPKVNWNDVFNHISSPIDMPIQPSSSLDYTEAQPLLLEGGTLVLLDSDNKVLAIDLEEDEADRSEETSTVKRVGVSKLRPGMFVLLRTSGGGDYIIPVADNLLGEKAQVVRHALAEWKARLRGLVEKHGLAITADKLRRLGANRAHEANVRYWMSDRSIKPASFQDFDVLLMVLGYNSDAIRDSWNAAKVVEKAHIRAGFYIRNQLLKEVLTSDLTRLRRVGRYVFELNTVNAGSLTAFRVTDVSPTKILVATSALGILHEGGDLAWRL